VSISGPAAGAAEALPLRLGAPTAVITVQA
jgi:hypothetical protein